MVVAMLVTDFGRVAAVIVGAAQIVVMVVSVLEVGVVVLVVS